MRRYFFKPVLIAFNCTAVLLYFTVLKGELPVTPIIINSIIYLVMIPILLKSEPDREFVFRITGFSLYYTSVLYALTAGIAYYFISPDSSAGLYHAYVSNIPKMFANTMVYLTPMIPITTVISFLSMMVLSKFSSKDEEYSDDEDYYEDDEYYDEEYHDEYSDNQEN